MNAQPIAHPGPVSAATKPTTMTDSDKAEGAQKSQNFAQQLRQAAGPRWTRDQIREVAGEFVAIAFFDPLFKQIREDPLRSDLFSGGRGEEVFQPQLHAELSRRMAHARSMPLVEAITESFANSLRLRDSAHKVGGNTNESGVDPRASSGPSE